MAAYERDEIPMLPASHLQSDDWDDPRRRVMSTWTRSVSMYTPMNTPDPSDYEHNLVGFTGPLRNQRRAAHIQMSGPLSANHNQEFVFQPPRGALTQKTTVPKTERSSQNVWAGNTDWPFEDYAGINTHLLKSGQLGMCHDPYCTTCPIFFNVDGHQKHSRTSKTFDEKFHNLLYGDAKGWAKRTYSFLFSYILGVKNPHAKVVQWWNKFFMISCLLAVFLGPLFFFLLYADKDNKCIVLDRPTTKVLVALRSIADFIYLLHILLQFRLAYVAPETRVAGSGDLVDDPKMIARNYFLGKFLIDFIAVLPLPQRVNQCFRDACDASNIKTMCMEYINCGGYGIAYRNNSAWELWRTNEDATACFAKDDNGFGIYKNALNLTTHERQSKRYVYALFWGFQSKLVPWLEIKSQAGNQVPSYSEFEVIFTMVIILSGLLLFALLIGNMQNFLQDIGRRRLEMSLRSRDVEQWMSHRRLPLDLQRLARDSERFNWVATWGVNEEMLIENLPEDLQREIRRHLFKFIKRVRIFQLLEEPIVEAICERLKMKTYIKGSKILYPGGLVDKMVFIIRGKMVSTGEDGIASPLSEGDVCGEELLTWSLEHSSVNKDGGRIRIPGRRMLSNRLVICLTYVEAFVLRVADLEQVTCLFARFLRSPRVQGAIRYESPFWRGIAARRIQVAWRYRKKRIFVPS